MPRNIHLVFKTHLDVGFTDYASAVIHNYFKNYIPRALRVAREMRNSGSPDRFIWTTGSWLIYEYLEVASTIERKEMEDSIIEGLIAWHGLPFTTHTELMDAELFRFGLSLSQSLDARFGRKTIAAKMTDVPGHTRAIIPLLAEAGIKFLHIGVNPGSTVPSVPGLFRWQDEQGPELTVMYESGYGSAFEIPGLEHSLAFGHTIDNIGPQSVEQVRDIYSGLRARFPGENVFASTLNAFAEELEPVRPMLPVITDEIGDTWIHGVGSDPIKVSRFRELLRLRQEWLSGGQVSRSDPLFINFNRWLLMVPEHTWGMDEKTFLGDHENYSREKFKTARSRPNFRRFESSWIEKRAYPQKAVNSLGESPLATQARRRLESIRLQMPNQALWKPVGDIPKPIISRNYSVSFDEKNGAINNLLTNAEQRLWSDETHRLGVLTYQTFSFEDYNRFFDAYIIPEQRHDWAREDFTKPGMEEAAPESRIWSSQVVSAFTNDQDERLFQLTFEQEAISRYGAPSTVFIRYTVLPDDPAINVEVQWFNKSASRLPEALWFSFQPVTSPAGVWRIEKMNREIDPLTVVENGNRHLHACGKYVAYRETAAEFLVSPLDSPLVAPGRRSLLHFNNSQPDMSEGIHFCLLNNLWGTNFPMWFEEDCLFRYKIHFKRGKNV